jgi:hypothetical protein
MKRVMIGKWARCGGAAAMLWLANGCTTFEESGLPGSASSMARNQIMLVRAEPESFGHYRLASLMRIYPDLDLFVAKRGVPDFLAETNNSRQHYYILYYLDERKAFAARTRAPHPMRLEFAGPYPITDKERKTLDQMKGEQTVNPAAPRKLSQQIRSF